MWKLLKFFGFVLKAAFWLSLLFLVVCLIALYILERDIPAPLVHRLATELSSEDLLVRIDRATFSLKSGLRLHRIKALPKRVADTALASADEVAIDLSLRPKQALADRIRGVTIKNVSMPALPPKQADKKDQPEPLLPETAPFPVTIENADILGIKASRVSATVSLQPKRVNASDITIQWPANAFSMSAAGHVSLDFSTRLVTGHVKGQALPENLLPLFEVLRAHGAIRQINSFSKLARPVDADYTFDVNIDNTDFAMILALDVGPCAYNNVPMEYAKGTLNIFGTNIYTSVAVGPIQAKSASGPITGNLLYREETEGLEIASSSEMDLAQFLDVINVLNRGELHRLRCSTPVAVSAQGVVALSSTKSTVTNDLSGKIAFKAGNVLNFDLHDATADFSLKGYSARFENIDGTSSSGGHVTGDITFFFPDYAATATVFTTHVKLADVDLSDLSRACNITNERAGLVSGHVRLDGRTDRNTMASLSGEGKVNIREGQLHRMRLFAGLTDYLAKNIPGVSTLVTQSSGSMDFTVRDGVLATDNLLIEGGLISITGHGTYNLVTDRFDFVVRANVFKQKTIAGKLTRLVTLPFARLLLEFKLYGSFEKPEWSYVNIIEKISDQLSDSSAAAPAQP